MPTDPCCNVSDDTPIACELGAISASDRPRYDALRRALASSVRAKRDLADGVAIQVAADAMPLADIAEWISFERLCCPFLHFSVDVAPNSGPVWVSLTGRAGVKDFLASAFSR